ncbi:ABC transporter substrate-binding protein [Streptomyces bobili]|uniref:ABC transporter substrate-binding protein n=1 Tax=Streptomyces bobili TaxID=67280 RepID=UPI00364CBEBB
MLVLTGCAQQSGSGGDGPVTLMVIESQTGVAGQDQTLPLGAKAAASSVNAHGGIGGRDIKIITCDTASDPNKAAECARKAVSQKVSAVVGSFDPIGISTSLPVLQAAKVPYLAPLATMPVEFSSPVSFPVTGGSPSGSFGMVSAAVDAKCKKVGTFGDAAADSGQTKALIASFKKAGLDAFSVNLPSSTSDPTPQVSQLLDKKPDCVAYAASGQTAVQVFSAIRRTGSDAQFISASATLLPPYLKALGSAAQGVIATSDTPPPASAELWSFGRDMEKYQPETPLSPFPLQGWYGVKAFVEVTENLDDLSAASVLDRLGTVDALRLPGLKMVDFGTTSDSKLYPRSFHPYVQYLQVEDGAYVPMDSNSHWHNVAKYLP